MAMTDAERQKKYISQPGRQQAKSFYMRQYMRDYRRNRRNKAERLRG